MTQAGSSERQDKGVVGNQAGSRETSGQSWGSLSGTSSERCMVKTLVLRQATDLVSQEPWAPMSLSPLWGITPTTWAGACLYSPMFPPCQPCAYLRESFPRLTHRCQQGSPAEEREAGSTSLVPTSCSNPSWVRPVGTHRWSLGLALTSH